MSLYTKIFNRRFSLRQVYWITNQVILAMGATLSLAIIAIVLQVKRNEAFRELANEADRAREKVESIFNGAETSVQRLADSFTLLSGKPSESLVPWFQTQGKLLLESNPAYCNTYFAFTKKVSRRLVKKDGYALQLKKDPKYFDSPVVQAPDAFKYATFFDPEYQTSPKEVWYQGAIEKRGPFLTPLYYDETYLKRVMISLTAAGRDARSGEVLGVAGVDLTAQSLANVLGEIKIGTSGGVLITDELGDVIAPFFSGPRPIIGSTSHPNANAGAAFSVYAPGAPLLPVEDSGTFFRGRDGKTYLLQSRKMQNRPYYLVAYQNRDEAYSTIYLLFGGFLVLGGLFFFISYTFRSRLSNFVFGNIDAILKNISGNRNLFEASEGEGKFNRIEPEGPTEITQIALQLNLLYARLQASFREIQSERDRAEIATQTKSRFLSVMSHEIRTPLNSMLGLTDVLLATTRDPEQVDHLTVLQRSGHSLLRILNDILDSSRLEAGKLEIEAHEFTLFALLHDVENLMRFDAEAKGVKFRIHAPPTDFQLCGDSIRIRQVLLNLVGNSIKFTTEGSVEIHVVALGEPEGAFRFEVSDTGIGIDTDHLPHLFTEFNQADATITRRYGGTGLGLSISQNLIGLLGGKITVESEKNRGTRFRFTLVMPVLAQWPSAYEESLIRISRHNPLFLQRPDTRNRAQMPRPEYPELPAEPDGKHAVLIVDDDEDNHRLLEAYLRLRKDLRAVHAFSGAEAIESVKNETFSLIIMDMQMPTMDGLEATRLIRALQKEGKTPPVPILVLSANTFAEDRAKSIEAGASAHVAKPIKLTSFNELIKRWIPGT